MIVPISASDLSEFCFPQGSLGVMPSVDRMFEGTAAHKKLQNIYKEDEDIKYQREVPLEYLFEYEDFSLKVQGRADGIFNSKSGWHIHEIKSTYVAPESIEKPLKQSHKAQMMIYAFIFATEHGLDEIQCRLSYFCLNEEKIVDFDYSFKLGSLSEVINKMADEYAMIVRRRIISHRAVVDTAGKLEFPFDSFRPGQRQGAAQIYSALIKSKNLLLQAPTGTGKTIMALFPAVKYLARDDARIFCLSAKNQTMAVTQQALDLMRAKGLKIKSCTIVAKGKCCPMESQDCSPEVCPYSVDYYQKVHDALPQLLDADDYNPEVILEFSRKYNVCPYELSLDLALEADIIICDYNYLFDPLVYLRRFFDFDGKYVFLIDEAHNLIDRGRDMYSSVITQSALREAKKLFDKEHSLYRSFGKILTQLNKLIKQPDEAIKREDTDQLRMAILQNGDKINQVLQRSTVPADALLLQKELMRFSVLLDYFIEESFILYHTGTELVLQCTDPSKMLEASVMKGSSAILYSATLAPYEFYKNSILPDAEAFGYMAEYPYDPANLKVIADYTVDTRYTNREKYYDEIARKICLCKSLVKGNIMVYFPSYYFMHQVALLMDIAPQIQPNNADSASRKEFLEALTSTSDILAFAVMGSHFAEGIDIKNISGIIIVGVALPQYNKMRENIQAHFEKKYNKGFEYAYVYPGINKVCQAAGRLIRSETDKGFLMLMDNRFKAYGHLLPKHWHINEVKTEADIKAQLSAFSG